MLSQLLSSKHKSSVVNLFLANPGRSFSMTEVRYSTDCPPRLLIQTMRELAKMGFLSMAERDKHRYYQVDKHFSLYPELVSMIRKNKRLPEDKLAKELSKLKEAKLILITGIFIGKPRIETDILLVGKISEKKLAKVLQLANKFAEQEVNYTLMPLSEFEYRGILSDRFVKNILENSPIIVTDKTKNKSVTRIVSRV